MLVEHAHIKECVFNFAKQNLLLIKFCSFFRRSPSGSCLLIGLQHTGLDTLVFAEFNRIVTTDLQSNFYGAVDRYTPRFVTIFKSKKGTVGEKLDELMQQMNTGKEADVTAMRTLVLRGLPILLGDDASNFYNTCNVSSHCKKI
ncbi:uncharacterized protein LOC109065479 isoform X5 [Cyprinus carpio]|uniref:Uncharacterized protein LOC109065479 isoform X5 n=1 Tax=Cyprinus carpio TaxID=7962 RepID=A0A9Q9YAX6_CYPCA|nr:uncharacterized protein LOC109065479 isoform X5 [Cyprinus carpio]